MKKKLKTYEVSLPAYQVDVYRVRAKSLQHAWDMAPHEVARVGEQIGTSPGGRKRVRLVREGATKARKRSRR